MINFSIIVLLSIQTGFTQNAVITGEKKANHKLTLTWHGPVADESACTYRDYRLNVTFRSPTKKTYIVPGYFAADGNAGESGATNGNKWRVHFLPIEPGEWNYEVSFRTGSNIATDPSATAGLESDFDGSTGSIEIQETDKLGIDFRGKGKLQYVGEHFLKFSDGDYFLKIGANSPEVFLEYSEFDGTTTKRSYPEHEKNWKVGDPNWQNGKGKGIIGVVNFFADQGLNTHYFLLMSAYGDGKETFPWTGADNYYSYDISKLDQWQIVFDHMMKKGIMPQFVLSEQENQSYFEHKEDGAFADSRKIFYREMVARFGYLNAVTWNIGEESGWENDSTFGKGINSGQRKDFAAYLQGLLYLDDLVVVHNGPSTTDAIFAGILGNKNYTGISYQGNFENSSFGHDRIAYWRKRSASNGRKWVVSYDEPYTGPEKPALSTWRKNAVWASFLAGGAGVEFYIGAGKDLTVEDYNIYSSYWATLRTAYDFFIINNLPFSKMESRDDFVTRGWCLAKPAEVYVIYLAEGGTSEIALAEGNYTVKWFNPRHGGALQDGSVKLLRGGDVRSIGLPPSDIDNDWVVLIKCSSPEN